jgi:hypothetical protein
VRAEYGEQAVFEVWLPPGAAPAAEELIRSAPSAWRARSLGARTITVPE